MNHKKLEEIHESLVNGQRKQMVKQIQTYGTYDFWEHYAIYLQGFYPIEDQLKYFVDAVISYHRIKAR